MVPSFKFSPIVKKLVADGGNAIVEQPIEPAQTIVQEAIPTQTIVQEAIPTQTIVQQPAQPVAEMPPVTA